MPTRFTFLLDEESDGDLERAEEFITMTIGGYDLQTEEVKTEAPTSTGPRKLKKGRIPDSDYGRGSSE